MMVWASSCVKESSTLCAVGPRRSKQCLHLSGSHKYETGSRQDACLKHKWPFHCSFLLSQFLQELREPEDALELDIAAAMSASVWGAGVWVQERPESYAAFLPACRVTAGVGWHSLDWICKCTKVGTLRTTVQQITRNACVSQSIWENTGS